MAYFLNVCNAFHRSDKRLESFGTWPYGHLWPPQDMAKAGFYYLQEGDKCGETLVEAPLAVLFNFKMARAQYDLASNQSVLARIEEIKSIKVQRSMKRARNDPSSIVVATLSIGSIVVATLSIGSIVVATLVL
uniref:Uncharacterized protein n=1 Tax=Timema bartmani TaxID=61472 RepID=A0A7R9FA98_9NEOP|nr:unnamed protein product [Timema bartmani]